MLRIFNISMVCALVLTCLASCSLFKSDKNETDGYSDNRKIMEQEAQRKLQTARVFMQKEDFAQAKKRQCVKKTIWQLLHVKRVFC